MSRCAYTVYVVPAEHRAGGNVGMALINGDDPLGSNAFGQPANASGDWDDLHTHFYGGMPSTEAWETQVSNLATVVPEPPGGWPIGDVTEADVMAAAEAMELQIGVKQDGTAPSPQVTLGAVLDRLGLIKVEPPL